MHGASKGGAKPLKIVSTIDSAMTISKTMAKSTERLSAAVVTVAGGDGGWYDSRAESKRSHLRWGNHLGCLHVQESVKHLLPFRKK